MLRDHEKAHHQEEYSISCPDCEFTCTNKSKLKCHQRVHNLEKPFTCLQCDYTCSWKSNMQAHMKRKHAGRKGTRKLKDKSPERETNREVKPRRQLMVNRRPFECPHCEANFVREDSLKSHIKYHSEVDSGTYSTALAVLELQNPVNISNKDRKLERVNKEHNYSESEAENKDSKPGVPSDEDEFVEIEETGSEYKTEETSTVTQLLNVPSLVTKSGEMPIVTQLLNVPALTAKTPESQSVTQLLNVPALTTKPGESQVVSQLLNVPALTTKDLYEQLSSAKEASSHVPELPPVVSQPGDATVTASQAADGTAGLMMQSISQPVSPAVSYTPQTVSTFTVAPQQVISLGQLGGEYFIHIYLINKVGGKYFLI